MFGQSSSYILSQPTSSFTGGTTTAGQQSGGMFAQQPQQQLQSGSSTHSATSMIGASSSTTQPPAWFQNQTKRTIPNHLVPKRKPSFQIATAATSKSSNNKKGRSNRRLSISSNGSGGSISSSMLVSHDQFNIVSFGSQPQQGQQRRAMSQGGDRLNSISGGSLFDTSFDISKYDDTINESKDENELIQFGGADDVPPARSIYDLNDEILVSLNKPVQQIDSFINKDPKSFHNLFNRDQQESTTESEETKHAEQEKRRQSVNQLQYSESAILVFGYPESLSNQVIQYFSEFGDILEQFEQISSPGSASSSKSNSLLSINSRKNRKIVPIFSGTNWVKITYDNPASAIDALQQNGSVFNGILLGVVPYEKTALEKLKKRKLVKSEDIGGTNVSLMQSTPKKQQKENGEAPLAEAAPASNGNAATSAPASISYSTKLDIKEGSQFFLKPDGNELNNKKDDNNKNKEKLGVLGTLSKYIFGFHDL
ncbi:uncharacterized protein J8A68_000408 [[Candida] subhashii]|uniref:RRM Nup35-type domain-containing protein n=1 Tax=[Candida] subhashii TaxID=561895 RepID=A0A8J5QSH4_9ASCO|nr:uncharacterized protein J8A68_000408 [[Candida] subhashii]KAG7665979.1 hypothetical protein J8A68_000408 [[Candida] subhashii]